ACRLPPVRPRTNPARAPTSCNDALIERTSQPRLVFRSGTPAARSLRRTAGVEVSIETTCTIRELFGRRPLCFEGPPQQHMVKMTLTREWAPRRTAPRAEW